MRQRFKPRGTTAKTPAPKKPKVQRVPRTRAGGEWTEADFWSFLRSGFRDISQRYPPIVRIALVRCRRPNQSANRRLKWEYQCAFCEAWFHRDDVRVDHIVPCGRLSCWDDVRPFLERLFVEPDALRVVCRGCHDRRHAEDEATKADTSRPLFDAFT